MKKIVSIALSLCMAMPAMAVAKGDYSRMDKGERYERTSRAVDNYFTRVDADGDGMIDKAEYDNYYQNVFLNADANNDRIVTMAEMANYRQQRAMEYRKRNNGEKYSSRSDSDRKPMAGRY